jgi:hypothetical protein
VARSNLAGAMSLVQHAAARAMPHGPYVGPPDGVGGSRRAIFVSPFLTALAQAEIACWCERIKSRHRPGLRWRLSIPQGKPMAAVVVHASKDGESKRMLYISPVIAVAKARGLFKTGWQVHIIDADRRVFHSEKFDQLLKFDPKPASKF